MRIHNEKVIVESEFNPFRITDYDEKVKNAIISNGLASRVKGKSSEWYQFNITGLIVIDDYIIAALPKTYRCEDDNTVLEDIKLLYKTLLKCENKIQLDSEGEISEEVVIQSGCRMTTVDFLINDFLENGLYYNEFKEESTLRSSKVLWGKTIKQKNPLISEGSLLYHDVVYERNFKDFDSDVILYHTICMRIIIERFGWLYDLSVDQFPELYVDTSYNNEVVEVALERELRTVNNVRKIDVLKAIIDILIGFDQDSNFRDNSFMYTRSFHTIWESVCGFIFKNDYKRLKDIVPKTEWDFVDGTSKKVTQIPDMMLIKESVLYIVDAKYYNVEKNTPGWHDMVKQFFYAYTVKKYLPSAIEKASLNMKSTLQNIDAIKNVFIYPTYDECVLKKHGVASIDKVQSLNEIVGYQLNCRFAMEAYTQGKKYNLIDFM